MLNTLKKAVKRSQKAWNQLSLKRVLKTRKSDFPIQSVKELNTLMINRAYLTDPEVIALQKYASLSKGSIAEIGCAFGASSALLLANTKPGIKVFSIDPFIVDSMGTLRASEESCRANVLQVLEAVKKESRFTDWKIIKDYSFNVVKSWNEPLTMIFIDGDHNYEAVRKDFLDWFPKVRSGGFILFHDSRKEAGTPPETFNRGWAGPTKLAEELKSDNRLKLIEEAFSLTIWQKY